VAHRLVQQDARPSRTENHAQLPSRCRARLEVEQGQIDRLVDMVVQLFLAEVVQIETSAASAVALLPAPLVFNNHTDRKAYERTHIGRDAAVESRNQHHIPFGCKRSHDLPNAQIAATRVAFNFMQKRDLGICRHCGNRIVSAVVVRCLLATKSAFVGGLSSPTPREAAGGKCSFHEDLGADPVGVGKGGFFALHCAHSNALLNGEAAGLHNALVQTPRLAACVLKIEVCIINAMLSHGRKRPRKIRMLQARRLQEGFFGQCKASNRWFCNVHPRSLPIVSPHL